MICINAIALLLIPYGDCLLDLDALNSGSLCLEYRICMLRIHINEHAVEEHVKKTTNTAESTFYKWVVNAMTVPNPTPTNDIDKRTVKQKSRVWPKIGFFFLLLLFCLLGTYVLPAPRGSWPSGRASLRKSRVWM